MTLKISLWSQPTSPDYSEKQGFFSLEISTPLKKASPCRNWQSIPQGGSGAPTTGPGPRQQRQGTALAGSSLGSQYRPAQSAPAVTEVGVMAELGLPGSGARRDTGVASHPRPQHPRLLRRIPDPFSGPPRPSTLGQLVHPSPGRSSGSSSKMRPRTPPAPSARSPAARDTVVGPGLPTPEMQDDDHEPWTQSRFRLQLPPEPQPRPQPRRRPWRLPFRPPSSHGPAARRQPSHVTPPGPAPIARVSDALPGDAGANFIPSPGRLMLVLSEVSTATALATA